jgi:outer membrane protein assembly factor BamA
MRAEQPRGASAKRLAVSLGVLLAVSGALAEATPYVGRRLSEVRFASDGPIDEAGLRTLLALDPGAPLTDETLDRSRRLLELTGLFRRIDLEIEPDGELARIVVTLSRKPVIGGIEIDGLDQLSEKEARRVIRIDKGTIYEPELADGAQERLVDHYRRLAFIDVAVQLTVEPRDGEVILRFDVAEGTPETIAVVIVDGDLAAWDDRLQKRAKRLEGGRRNRDAVR